MKTYYETLGVSESADAVTIKKAYKQLVKKYHPDIYKGEDRDTKFQEIQKAYDVLSVPEKKSIYDNGGHDRYEQAEKYGNSNQYYQNFNDFSSFSGFGSYTNMKSFSDVVWWKKILIIFGLIMLAIIFIIGFCIVTIFKLIVNLINQIFK